MNWQWPDGKKHNSLLSGAADTTPTGMRNRP